MKKASKYSIGSVFYLPTIKQYVMVVTPVEAGTVVYVVSAGDLDKTMKYNIRTNYCETCQKNKKLSPRASK